MISMFSEPVGVMASENIDIMERFLDHWQLGSIKIALGWWADAVEAKIEMNHL